MELFALDLGNIQTKIKSRKTEKVLPSKYAYYEDLGNQVTALRKGELDINEYEVNYDDTFSYAWGKDISQAKVKSFIDTIGFNDRYSSDEFKKLVKFSIGELAKDFPVSKENILNVNVVTGVPTDEFNENSVKTIMDVIKGDHNVTINSVSYVIRVIEVKVLPQPIGTIYNEMLDDNGYIENEDYENETISVVDCGGGTVLIDTLHDMNLSKTERNQTEQGAHYLYDYIIADSLEYNLSMNRNDVEKILRNQNEKYIYSPNKNEKHDITNIVNKAITRYTSDLLNLVKTTLKDTSDIDTLFFTGGGANIINQSKVLKTFDRAIFINDSETANVNGFYKFGMATIESDSNVE